MTTKFIQETPEQWLDRHNEHCTEELTPANSFETCCFMCYDCNEICDWKDQEKVYQE